MTSYYDASPIASPTSGAPPTGTFALTLGQPQETQCDCLTNNVQKPAWDCNLAPNSLLGIQVTPPNGNQGMGARIFDASFDNSIAYGAQINYMNSSFAQFLTVQDNDDKAKGPAFYFQKTYDKVVVLPESAIPRPSKRDIPSLSSGWQLSDEWQQRKQVANPGDRPWFCFWNATLLEGFIYITENAHKPTTSSSKSSTSTSSILSTPTVAATSTSVVGASTTSSYSPSMPTYGPLAMITRVATFPKATTTATATYTGPAGGWDAWYSALSSGDQDPDDYHSKFYNGGAYKKRDIPGSEYWNKLPSFPYMVKLEERRVAGSPQPYCQQFQVLDNHSLGNVADDDGDPIMVQLSEKDPDFSAYVSAGVASTSRKRRSVAGGCHCQWISGDN